jgi:hypothetical protein
MTAPRSRAFPTQREALSKKCADINLEVPALMGVSKVRQGILPLRQTCGA